MAIIVLMNLQERNFNQGFRDNVGYTNPTLLQEFKGNEIKVGFSGFFNLPLFSPILTPGFVRCPAGVVITEERLWLAHLPFLEDWDERRLWRSWYRYESSPPLYSLAFGMDVTRLIAIEDAMKRRTRSKEVAISAAIPERQELFDLKIEQNEAVIMIRFEERATPDNHIVKELQI